MRWITDRKPTKSGGYHVKGKNFAMTTMYRVQDKTFLCEANGRVVEAWLDETKELSPETIKDILWYLDVLQQDNLEELTGIYYDHKLANLIKTIKEYETNV